MADEQRGQAPCSSTMEEADPLHRSSSSGSEIDLMNSKDSEVAQQLKADVAAVLERSKALTETATAFSSKLQNEGDALGKEAIAVEGRIKELRKQVAVGSEAEDISNEMAEELEDALDRARSMAYEGDVRGLLPHKANGFFLSLFLGQVNVLSARQDIRLKVKEEYNSYRDRTAVIFLAFPLVLLVLKHYLWKRCFPALPVQAYQSWLMFFYLSLALRENILRINGSDIRPWWIHHHYYAIFATLVSLTWGIHGADCEHKQEGVIKFLQWAVVQGVAMLLQNRYQRRRLYTRIALGKAGRMDVVWGETAGVKGQLWVLYPVLFTLQGFQMYNGVILLRSYMREEKEWQIALCGALLVLMAVGNFTNTIATVIAKMRIKARMRKKGREMLKHMSSIPNLKKES